MSPGDFNRMNLDGLCAQLKLNKCVVFFTYQNSIFDDHILTDIDEYPSAVKLPPLVGNENDHCSIYLGSIFVRKRHYTVVTKRVITPASRQSVLIDIAKQDWKDVLSAPCADTKTDALNQIIVTILDNHCPLKKFKTRADKPNYITPSTKYEKREIERIIKTIRPGSSSVRSEEHTSELQSPVPISYAVFCLKKKNKIN